MLYFYLLNMVILLQMNGIMFTFIVLVISDHTSKIHILKSLANIFQYLSIILKE